MHQLAAFAALTALLVGCSHHETPAIQSGVPEDTVPRMDQKAPQVTSAGRDSLLHELYEFGSSYGQTRETIVSSLGNPSELGSFISQNPYSTHLDSVFQLRYPGWYFGLRRDGETGRELLSVVEATGSRSALPGGFSPQQTSLRGLTGKLAQPHHEDRLADTLVLSYGTPNVGSEEFLQFYVVADTLRKVRWALYVD